MLGAGGLAVDSSSPDALCPPLEETRRAVAERLGSVELEGTWHASYVLVHRAQGDFVSLTLADPDGVLRLERDLPVQGGACATLSQVVALVLERFFSRPEHSTQEEASATAAPPPLASPSPLGSSATTTPELPAPAPLALPVVGDAVQAPHLAAAPPLRFRAGAALWTTNAWVAPSIRLERSISRPIWLAFNAAFDLPRHELAAAEGSLSLRRLPLSLLAVWELDGSATFNPSAALEVLGVLEHAQATGLRDDNSGTRIVPGIGARLGARFLRSASAGPFVELTAAWFARAAAPEFQVGQREVFRPASWVLGLAFGINTPF